VLVYFTTAHNAREYYNLTDRETIPVHSWDDSTLDDVEGDIELNPVRNNSFESCASDNNMLPPTTRGKNGFAAVRSFDPLDSELDLISTSKSAPLPRHVGETTQGIAQERRNSSSSGLSPRQRTATLQGNKIHLTIDGSSVVDEQQKVDATLHLLSMLETLHQQSATPLATELVALRKVHSLHPAAISYCFIMYVLYAPLLCAVCRSTHSWSRRTSSTT
jgi:hypothetical protein